jgi:hypothetical protein
MRSSALRETLVRGRDATAYSGAIADDVMLCGSVLRFSTIKSFLKRLLSSRTDSSSLLIVSITFCCSANLPRYSSHFASAPNTAVLCSCTVFCKFWKICAASPTPAGPFASALQNATSSLSADPHPFPALSWDTRAHTVSGVRIEGFRLSRR